MPTYDYRCEHCGHAFSAVQSFNDDPLAACPACGKAPQRLVAMPAIVFKGSGWYKTDSRSTPKEEKPADKRADKASGDGSSGGKASSAADKPASSPS